MELQNEQLVALGNFLQSLTLPAQVSRAKTKLVKALSDAVAEYTESDKELIAEHNGEILDNSIDFSGDSEAMQAYLADREVLQHELVEININQPTLMKALKDYFAKYDGDISPEYAGAFDAFYDALTINVQEQAQEAEQTEEK